MWKEKYMNESTGWAESSDCGRMFRNDCQSKRVRLDPCFRKGADKLVMFSKHSGIIIANVWQRPTAATTAMEGHHNIASRHTQN